MEVTIGAAEKVAGFELLVVGAMTIVVADDAAQHGVGGEGDVEFVLRFCTKELVAHADGLPLLMNGDRINRGDDGVG